jgi:hypothetical protein
MAHVYRSVSVTVLLLAFFGTARVQAQQPLAEIGGWPSGALTLLVGAWLSIQCLSESKYDVLPTILFARILHRITTLRRFLTSDIPFGSLTKEVVLTPIEYSGMRIIQEWDSLILPSRGVKFKLSCRSFTFRQVECINGDTEATINHDNMFSLEIVTGLDMERFTQAVDQFLQEMDLEKDDDKPRIGELLRLWRALRIYQQCRQQTEWSEDYDQRLFNDGTQHYKRMMKSTGPTANQNLEESNETPKDILNSLEKTKMSLHYPDSPYGANELPVGAIMEDEAVSAKHLAAMLAFTEYICGDSYKGINPLILCIWIWMQGRLHPSDSMVITLPPSRRFIYPQSTTQLTQEIEEPNRISSAPNVLDLSSDDWDIDGGTFMNAWKVIWVFSLITSVLIAFFVVVSGGGNPSLATTLGLLFVRPYSIDSNLHDSGYPPSWNGRRRLRWDNGYACGLFKGKHYKKMGPTGNSLFRCIVVYVASWITWYLRTPLRRAMQFARPAPTSTWVLWVAICFECMAMLAMFMGIFMLIAWRQVKASIALTINFIALAICFALMVRYMATKQGHKALFWYSELGILTAILYAAVIHRGVGPSHGPFVWYNAIVWIHTIASSCFYST